MTIQQTVQIIQALLQDVLWPVAAILVPVVWHKFKAHLPQNKQIVLDGIVRDAVQMVHQRFGNLSPEGKRKEAEDAIYASADFFEYKSLDPDVVRTILESIVWETKQTKLEGVLTVPKAPQINKQA
jgi:hypothetical protein